MEIDVIMLAYTKNVDTYNMTANAIKTLRASESNFFFNVIILETNKSYFDEFEKYDCNVFIIPPENFNYNKFVNIGLRLCKNDYVIISNNDVIFHPNWFYEIHQSMNSGIHSASPYCPEWFLRCHMNDNCNIQDITIGYTVNVHVFGYCIVAKKEVYETIGKLDEQFEFWYQDMDYAMQLKKHGLIHALIKKSHVTHLGSKSHDFLSDDELIHFKDGMYDVYKKKI